MKVGAGTFLLRCLLLPFETFLSGDGAADFPGFESTPAASVWLRLVELGGELSRLWRVVAGDGGSSAVHLVQQSPPY